MLASALGGSVCTFYMVLLAVITNKGSAVKAKLETFPVPVHTGAAFFFLGRNLFRFALCGIALSEDCRQRPRRGRQRARGARASAARSGLAER